MNRDFVCIFRLALDSLPVFIRNSRFLFYICKKILNVPDYFFSFRRDYEINNVDLADLYSSSSPRYSRRLSPSTDINSFHLKYITRVFRQLSPNSFLDVGCGSGFLLNNLVSIGLHCEFTGIDYQCPSSSGAIKFQKGSLNQLLSQYGYKSFNLVTCTHTLEHLQDPNSVITQLLHISDHLILVIPLERKFRWGLNYHINFYPNKQAFLSSFDFKSHNYECFQILGDLLIHIYD